MGLSADRVYFLCNRYRWFTLGSHSFYEKMFEMIR